jgi:hypothetical protein
MMVILRFRKFGYYLCNDICCRNRETYRNRHTHPTNRVCIKALRFGGTLKHADQNLNFIGESLKHHNYKLTTNETMFQMYQNKPLTIKGNVLGDAIINIYFVYP